MVEVTVFGEVDPKTGMVVNLFDLKRVLLNVLEEFDHKNLNLDMPYFKDRIPTSENLARVLWSKLDTQKDIGTLHAIRLYEDEDLYAEVTAAAGSTSPASRGATRSWRCRIAIRAANGTAS